MMELPNYSSQLMQQLWTLRKEGQFCDCTILVGESPHRAHKLVLAASSLLFRSLLDSSDTISIDTAVVSSQEFGCLLDMVYTGKLPLGKHNVSRIVAAADSLQMFDVAVGFKNVLTSLVNQQPAEPQTPTLTLVNKLQSAKVHDSDSPSRAELGSDETELKTEPKTEPKTEVCQDGEDAEEPAKKRVCVESTGQAPEKSKPSETTAEEENITAVTVSGDPTGEPTGDPTGDPTGNPTGEPTGDPPGDPTGDHTGDRTADHTDDPAGDPAGESTGDPVAGHARGFLDCSSQMIELLANMPSVLQLLNQAAQSSSLEEQERQDVCECCEEADPSLAMEKLLSRVEEGLVSEAALLRLLRAVQLKAPSSFPKPLLPLLEEAERNMPEPAGSQTAAADSEQQNGNSSEGNPEKAGEEDHDKEETEEDEKDPPSSASSSPSSPSKPYSCRWCKKGFAYKCRMAAHMKRCSMSQECEQQCPQCPKKLANQRALQRHRAEAHRNTARVKKKVACDLCGRTFAHPSGMIYHKRTEHFEEKPFACEQCGAKFGANSSLKNHMRLHTGEKPYHCKHCDMSFSVAAALAYHTKKKHSEGKMYVCQYCKAVFAQSIELTRHVRTHTGDRPYVCRECGKGYSQASGLTVHLHTFHNLSEPHDCQKCCLSFSSLEEHRQHIEEFHPKEFHKCPTCSKVFTSAALLDKHKTTHTGTKPFSCDLCNKSYQQLSGLWYHNRTNHPDVFANHTRQLKTLVQCDVCFKFFPSAASVAKHQAAEHQGSAASTVRCVYCPAVLGGEEELQEHVSSQHGSQSSEVFSCLLCNTVCTSHLQMQEHLLTCQMETQEEQEAAEEEQEAREGEQEQEAEEEQQAGEEQASSSHTVIATDPAGDEGAEQVPTQQVFVALAGGREGGSEVVEVNMYDLLNNSVTFICEDKQSPADS